jgi:hypothetical protein
MSLRENNAAIYLKHSIFVVDPSGGKEVATQKMEHTIPLILQWDETFDIGSDTGTPVDDRDYQVQFKFTGKLPRLTLKLDRPKMTPEDIKKLEAAQRNHYASE